jgi:hypothetical protein
MKIEWRLPHRALPARLRASRRGAVAPILALMLPALLGTVAFSVDLAGSTIARSQMQIAADSAALAAVQGLGRATSGPTPTPPVGVALEYIRRNVPATYGDVTRSSDVTIGSYSAAGGFVPGETPTSNAVRVVATRSADRNNRVNSIFGFYWIDTVSVAAIAAKPRSSNYEPPQSTNLDPEAGDYNEIYAYCYDYGASGAPADRRSQMTLISNNMGGNNIVSYSGGVISVAPAANPPWPDCRGAGKSISLRMRNIRHAKSIQYLWANPNADPRRTEYNYYTDTRLAGGQENYDGLTSSILETILCDSAANCDPGHLGSNRTPRVAREPCVPGKFKYFGWEDRPPGQSGANGNWTDPAWTDTDYDDIRIILKCPREGRLGDAYARLVK